MVHTDIATIIPRAGAVVTINVGITQVFPKYMQVCSTFTCKPRAYAVYTKGNAISCH